MKSPKINQAHWAKNTMFPSSRLIRIPKPVPFSEDSKSSPLHQIPAPPRVPPDAPKACQSLSVQVHPHRRHFKHYLPIVLLLLGSREWRRLKLITRTSNACEQRKGTSQTRAKVLILWHFLKKWKVSRRNTEGMHSPSHMASVPFAAKVVKD